MMFKPKRMDRSLHVVFVIAGLSAGGAERVLNMISSAWAAKGWHVTIVAFDEPDEPIYHDFDPAIKILRFGIAAGGGVAASVLAQGRRLLAIRRHVKRARPDLVISLLTKINVLTLLATWGLQQKIIVSERNNPRAQNANPAWNTLLNLLYPRASAIVMQTRGILDCLPVSVRAQAKVIPNPISTPILSKLMDPEALVMVAAGRLAHQKGFDLLVEAFARIAPQHPAWKLQIWGEGELRSALQAQIERMDMSGRIELRGISQKPGKWLEGATAFVLSSRYEGFANVLAEAMLAGLPVIAFECDFGPQEIVHHGMDGLLVPKNDVSALAGAMDHIMTHADVRERLGAKARQSAKRFAPATVIAQWDALVDTVIGSPTGNATQSPKTQNSTLS